MVTLRVNLSQNIYDILTCCWALFLVLKSKLKYPSQISDQFWFSSNYLQNIRINLQLCNLASLDFVLLGKIGLFCLLPELWTNTWTPQTVYRTLKEKSDFFSQNEGIFILLDELDELYPFTVSCKHRNTLATWFEFLNAMQAVWVQSLGKSVNSFWEFSFVEFIHLDDKIKTWALADPKGGGGSEPPPTLRFGGPSVQFKSKTMNFMTLILYFFKQFSAFLCSASILYIFHILLVSFCLLFYIHIHTCAYFYIIWTQPITLIKVKYFCTHYCTKMSEN